MSTLLIGVRDSIFCSIERYKIRIFAGYCTLCNAFRALRISYLWVLVPFCIMGVFLFPRFHSVGEGLLIALCVWSMRPSTEPKTFALFSSQLIRFLLVACMGLLFCLCSTWLATWLLVLSAYFIFEARPDRTIFSLPLSMLFLMSTTLAAGLFCCVCDSISYLFFSSLRSVPELLTVAGILLRVVIVSLVSLPLIIEQFHINRAWYEPL